MTPQVLARHAAFGCALLLVTSCSSSEPTIGISGSTAPIVMGLTRQFHARFPGVPEDSITWDVFSVGGMVDPTGLYTAGSTAGTYAVSATAMSDPTLTDTIQVTVVPFGGTPTHLGFKGYGVAVSKHGVIASADNNTQAHFYSGGTDTYVTLGGSPAHVAFSPSGAHAFVTTMGGGLFRINVGGSSAADTAQFGRAVYNLAVRSTDSVVYATTEDGWLFKVAPTTLALLDSVKLASASNGLAFTKDGGALWVSTIAAGVVYRLDPSTLAKVDSFDLGSGTQRLTVAPSGDSVYVADQDSNAVFIIRPSTRTVTKLSVENSPHGVGISSDGSKLFVARIYTPLVSVFDRKTLTFLGYVDVGGTPRNIVPVPGSSAMVVGTEMDVVRIN